MKPSLRVLFSALLLLALALVPMASLVLGHNYLVSLFTRIVILSIAAMSLNLILGYGGLISFGHAVYVGIGAYTVGILAHHGVVSGFVQWPAAILISALFALVVGSLCLRAKGVHFIMITLAFSQMVYFLAVGVDKYGGDDGLTIYSRSVFAGLIDLSNRNHFYYLCLALLGASAYLISRLTNSHFGLVIQGAKSNEQRLQSLGVATFPYQLTAFVMAGALCGLAGVLLANHTDFVSPELMHWTRSGDLMIMVILGGLGTLLGPIAGTVAFLLLEEVLSGLTEHWQILLGPLLVLMALYKKGGIAGLLKGGSP
jgi:branched-chain amino acid transport system permease protein